MTILKGYLAWSTWVVSILLIALSTVLLILNRGHANPFSFEYWLPNAAGGISTTIVGTIIVIRRKENVIGRLFAGVGIGSAVVAFGGEYAAYTMSTAPGLLPAGEIAAWIANLVLGFVWTTLFTFILLLFPTGKPLSRRWRPLVCASAVVLAVMTIATAVRPGSLNEPFQFVVNPIGISRPQPVVDGTRLLTNVLGPVPLLIGALAVVSLILRLRRSRSIERQQIKWFAYSIASFIVLYISVLSLLPLMSVSQSSVDLITTVLIVILLGGGIPIAIGFAILRYHLYDIDRIINKTLVYGVLTAILIGADMLLVLVLERLLGSFVSGSSLIVAGSTLLVAALIRPLRSRIQTAVDRRFYRQKYDAARTLEAFSLHLRDQTDLAALATELGSVVHETMQPTQVSLWIKEPGS